MKKLLIVLMFIATTAFAFSPKDLQMKDVVGVTPCGASICLFAEKDGRKFIIIGDLDEKYFYAKAIFEIINKVPVQVWGANWKEV